MPCYTHKMAIVLRDVTSPYVYKAREMNGEIIIFNSNKSIILVSDARHALDYCARYQVFVCMFVMYV